MEEEDDEPTTSLSKTSSTVTLTQQSISIRKTASSSSAMATYGNQEGDAAVPQCQIVTHQASGDSMESEESTSTRISPRYSLLSKSPHSSSSQEDYDVDRPGKGQFLSTGARTETTKSMESLRTARTFLSTSDRDMRHISAGSLEAIDSKEMKLKRHAVSGEGTSILGLSEEAISAEKRRGLWSGKARVPQHLSLPPPAGYLNLSPGDRKLTILSPHSPMRGPDYMHLSQSTLKIRRKKALVLPRLVLPRSESEISEVFSEHGFK